MRQFMTCRHNKDAIGTCLRFIKINRTLIFQRTLGQAEKFRGYVIVVFFSVWNEVIVQSVQIHRIRRKHNFNDKKSYHIRSRYAHFHLTNVQTER